MNRTDLGELLWPTVNGSKQMVNLRQTLTRLRHVLNKIPEVTVKGRERVYLQLSGEIDIDIELFDTIWGQLDQLALAEKWWHVKLVEQLEQLTELYQGAFWSEYYGEGKALQGWIQDLREKYEDKILLVWYKLGEYYSQVGDLGNWRKMAVQQIETRSWHERGHQQLMRYYLQMQDFLAVMYQYGVCKQALEKRFLIGPDQESWRIYTIARQLRETTKQIEVVPHFLGPIASRVDGNEQILTKLMKQLVSARYRAVGVIGADDQVKTGLLQAVGYRFAALGINVVEHPFPDGVWWLSGDEVVGGEAPLAERLAQQVLQVMGEKVTDNRSSLANLGDQLRGKRAILLINKFDLLVNRDVAQEKQTDGVDFVLLLLKRLPQLTVLVSSQQSLGEELIYEVPIAPTGLNRGGDSANRLLGGMKSLVY
ncbi:MAG TPA: hypothetical protein VLL52_17630 [Anaerolineae bacterium]|nr:hypothetical protein [Anaerolineae bacterium]